jgi:clorobiocin biosynthesis protein CloN5
MALDRDEVARDLTQFVAREILDGHDIGLDAQTPLLEWGIINSFEITRVISFVHERFQVEIPAERIVVQHFDTIDHLTDLVTSLAGPGDA